ncbi:hypothetical protein [uncultured Roseovarius sp.]|uniref:hypothetical protein n=1 Tax=uncultured Roseovarius sp. TaxID=293344 RepID=UPI0026027442|nr:hypothetical protein [uncultured Roseovarius sp.]
MARKQYLDEGALRFLREIEVHFQHGPDVASVNRKAGISDKIHYYGRKKFGVTQRPQLPEITALKKTNERLKKIAANLQSDKLFLKESLDHLKPKG